MVVQMIGLSSNRASASVIQDIQSEDRAIRERGSASLAKEILIFFSIQMAVLGSVFLVNVF